MRAGEAFPGKWLKSDDLGDDDHVVTIKDTHVERIGQGEQAADKVVIQFGEFEKALVCNKTNFTQIAKVTCEEDSDDWPGHRITIYANHDIPFGNEIVSAIRVRSKAPQQAKKAISQRPVGTNGGDVLTYKQAVELCGGAGLTEDDMKAWLKQNGMTGYNGVACTPLVRTLVAGLVPTQPQSNATEDEIPF